MIDKTFTGGLHETGYDREEEYFFHLNRQLINENRRNLDIQRRERIRLEGGKDFWMRCPNCGHDLETSATNLGLRGDVCKNCGGIFFMHDELLHLTETHEPGAFKAAVMRILGDLTKPRPSGIGQFPV